MRTSHVAPIAAVLTLSLLPAAPALAAAADTAPPEVHSITFDKTAVTVSGVQTQFVGVRVHLTDESGVQPIEYQASQELASPWLQFNTTLNSVVLLRLAEGTDKDGIWTGSIPVTSAWSGTVKPIGIYAIDTTFTNKLEIDPGTKVEVPSLQVTSSHRPALEMTFSPEPLPKGKPVVQKIRAWDTTTGKAWPNLSFKLSTDNGCVEPGGETLAKTGAAGTYQRTISAPYAQWLQCAWVPGVNQPTMPEPRTMIAVDAAYARTARYTIGVVPAATSAKAGTNVNVNGNVTPLNKGKVIQLQRLYADKTWHKVGTTKIRNSGRYTLVATPPGKGTYSYRVYVPGDDLAVGTISKSFTIRGT